MNKITKITLSSLAAILLAGCGSGGSSSDTGYLIDSEVIGVSYSTSSGLTGTTDIYGRFQYQNGDDVTFSLGNLVLGTTQPNSDGLVTPETLIVGDNSTPTQAQSASITLMLQTLQSLDDDNITSNGLRITNEITSRFAHMNQRVYFKDIDENYLLDLDQNLSLGLDEDGDGLLDINSSAAIAHHERAMKSWQYGSRPDKYATGETSSFNLSSYPITQNLTQELKDGLAYMGNEERLAYDLYTNLYNYYFNNGIVIKQLTNIANNSEIKHIALVQEMVRRYNITDDQLTDVNSSAPGSSVTIQQMPTAQYDLESIQNLYDSLYNLGTVDTASALKVGCMVEVTDINDLNNYIQKAEEVEAYDIQEGFKVLRAGSYNHYWSFDYGLKRLGYSDGCYFSGDPLLTNKVDIYPPKESLGRGKR